jgi:hypothetical protein
MKRLAVILASLWIAAVSAIAQEPALPAGANAGAPGRFAVIDVMLDSKAEPLAAYQVELTVTNNSVKIVGIEGGDPAVFRDAPYYDPAAMQGDRVILGAFTTTAVGQLPRGNARVASVHCLIAGPDKPIFNAKVVAAATAGGQPITVQISVKERDRK